MSRWDRIETRIASFVKGVHWLRTLLKVNVEVVISNHGAEEMREFVGQLRLDYQGRKMVERGFVAGSEVEVKMMRSLMAS